MFLYFLDPREEAILALPRELALTPSPELAAAVNRVDCCTPDWFPGSDRIIFSWRPRGQKENEGYGWTQLWMADAEGKERKLVYGEDGLLVGARPGGAGSTTIVASCSSPILG